MIASPTIAIPAVPAGHGNARRATDLPTAFVRNWVGWSGGHLHRQDYPKHQGQFLGWPHSHLHQLCLDFDQRSRPKRAPR